jgi:hypothetical protein
MLLLLRLVALSLLLAVATPIRDIADACSSQITGTAASCLSFIILPILSWFWLPSVRYIVSCSKKKLAMVSAHSPYL